MDIGFPSAWPVGRVDGIQGTQVSLLSVAFLFSLWLLTKGKGKRKDTGKSAEDVLEKKTKER